MTKHEPAALAAAPDTGTAGQPDPARRSFLKALPLGAIAVVAGGAATAEAAPAAAVAPVAAASQGYRETEHIRRYYQTAAYW
jgi:hypothetical protein